MKHKIGTNSFLGNFHVDLRVNGGRAMLGVGHTHGEAWRNACDGHAERNPELEGVMAVLREMRPQQPVKPELDKPSPLKRVLRDLVAVMFCALAMTPVIIAGVVMLVGVPVDAAV